MLIVTHLSTMKHEQRKEICASLSPSQVSPAEGYASSFTGVTPVSSHLPTLGTSSRDAMVGLAFTVLYLVKS